MHEQAPPALPAFDAPVPFELSDTPALIPAPVAAEAIPATESTLEPNAAEQEPEPLRYTFTQTQPYSHAWPDGKPPAGMETVLMPSANADQTKAAMKDTPATPIGNSSKSQQWAGTLNGGLACLPYSNAFNRTVERVTATWSQSIPSSIGPLAGVYPGFRVKEGTKLTGDTMRRAVRASLNLGAIFTFPAVHSGFWISLKAPGENALLDLFQRIDAEKTSLGRATYGLIFANGSSYINKIMLDFCIEHLYETSLRLDENDDIRKYIRVPDLPLLIWGLAAAIYSGGFPYQRACIAEPEKCRFMVQERLSIDKLQITDTSCLTARQIAHMTKRQRGSVSGEEVQRYVSEFIRGQDLRVQLTPTLAVILKVPSAIEHIDAGYRWVSDIEDTYGRALAQDEKVRDEYLVNQGKATIMRQYSHFVRVVEVDGQSSEEQEDIDNFLDDLSASDEVRNLFLDEVAKFVDESVGSLIAIPTYKCPSCNKDQPTSKKGGLFTGLIPLDVSQTFFTLLVQKVRKVQVR